MLTTIIVLILLLQVAARSIAEYYFNRYVWATQPKRGRGEESVAANKARKKASVIFDSAAIAIPAILLTGFNWMALIGLGFILWALRTFGVNVCADLGLKRELFHAFDENSTAWTDRMIYKASRLVRMEVKKFLYLLYALTMGIGIILLTIGKTVL
jgi:fatty acid desaturase